VLKKLAGIKKLNLLRSVKQEFWYSINLCLFDDRI